VRNLVIDVNSKNPFPRFFLGIFTIMLSKIPFSKFLFRILPAMLIMTDKQMEAVKDSRSLSMVSLSTCPSPP
jgi:hypothetical protein